MTEIDFVEERLVFFPCGEVSLAGVLGVPQTPIGLTIVIPWGAGAFPSSGRNRLRTRLARTLVLKGFHTFRFDYRGVGESQGNYEDPDMAKPRTEELLAACEFVHSQGLDRIAIVGNCFGAWSALMVAPELDRLVAVALVNTPVNRDHVETRTVSAPWRWWLKKIRRFKLGKLRSAQRRALYRKLIKAKTRAVLGQDARDTRFAKALGYLLDSRIPVLLMYGKEGHRAELEAELAKGLRTAFDRARPPTRLAPVEHRLAGWASLEVQDLMIKEIVPWLEEVRALSPSQA